MKFKGTPNDWETTKNIYGEPLIFVRADEDINNQVIAKVVMNGTPEENKANTQVMVVAPELLEELEKCKNTLINCINELPHSYKEAVRARVLCTKTIITKALNI